MPFGANNSWRANRMARYANLWNVNNNMKAATRRRRNTRRNSRRNTRRNRNSRNSRSNRNSRR